MDQYALTNFVLLDGTHDMQPQKGLALLIEDGKIQKILSDSAIPGGWRKIDLDGQYLLPGLINLHVHLAGSGKPQKKQTDPVKAVKLVTRNSLTRKVGMTMVAGFAKELLRSGVTTIRTVGGIEDFDARTRDAINAGKLLGPRILAGNMAISVPGGHHCRHRTRSDQADGHRRRTGRGEKRRTRHFENVSGDHPRRL